MKKVAIIGTAGIPSRYGGFETLAHHLVDQLNSKFKLYVYCSKNYYKKEERVRYFNKARLFYLPFNANGIQSIIYDIVSVLHALFYADTLIVLGVSGGILIPFVKKFTRKKIIVNIDGLEWRRDKWSSPVKKFLKLSERLAVKYSDADITDNEAIQRYTAINYKTLSHLIEYGADHVISKKLTNEDYLQYPFLRNPYAFKVCRIEPENNIHLILEAFATLSDKTLVIIGNWANSEYGKKLKEKYSTTPKIHLLDPIYDQVKLDKIRSNCYIYLHGHSAGGTNPSLVEAMYLGLPVIAFDVSYNRFTTENKAFYFKEVSELIQIIKSKRIIDYQNNKASMLEIAHRRYTWRIIAQKYTNLIYCFDYKFQKNSIHSNTSNLDYSFLQQQGLAHLKRPKLFYEEDTNY